MTTKTFFLEGCEFDIKYKTTIYELYDELLADNDGIRGDNFAIQFDTATKFYQIKEEK